MGRPRGVDGPKHPHVRAACEQAGLTHNDLVQPRSGASPMVYMDRFACIAPQQQNPRWPKKLVRVIYAPYDLTFLREFSEGVLREFFAPVV